MTAGMSSQGTLVGIGRSGGWRLSSRSGSCGRDSCASEAVTSVVREASALIAADGVGAGGKGGAGVGGALVDVDASRAIAIGIVVTGTAAADKTAISVGTSSSRVTCVGTKGAFVIIGTGVSIARIASITSTSV